MELFRKFIDKVDIRPLDKKQLLIANYYFSYFSNKTYVVGTQKNCLNETVLLSTKTSVKLMDKNKITFSL